MTQSATLQAHLRRLQQRSLIVGVSGLGCCLVGVFLNPGQFFRSYLLAYLFWLGLALGCLAIVMLHHLVRGAWGAVIQRLLESGTRTLPLLAVLVVPLLFGVHDLYIWARPQAVASDALLQHKSLYLNVPFFMLRTGVYFVVWIGVAYCLNRWSLLHDQAPDLPTERSLRRRLQLLSGPGLVLYGITTTFAAIDWAMSLEPYWYSTIYGVLFIVNQGVATLAGAIICLALLWDREPFASVVVPAHFHDLGNLLLTFVMLWAYVAFSQFLIIWFGNLPEEIPWYVHRTQGGWQWIGLSLLVVHFVLPFLLLLSRGVKRGVPRLAAVALAIMCMHLVDLFWLVMPAFHPVGLYLHWLDVVAPLGIGGLWVAVFVWQLQRRPLLPLHDPRLQGALEHG
ncbi:MAG TPA: hypothetical protein VLQ80_27805 [Candidatus Saccharimonadia bacterium]|nr:hypothetical protein [Candidatus Saccharimonadia bacterium]